MLKKIIKLFVSFFVLVYFVSCGITTNTTIIKNDISLSNELDSVCVITNKVPINNMDIKFENIIIENLYNSKKIKLIIRIDSLLALLGVEKGLVLNPDLSYLKTIYQKTGIRYFLICSLGEFDDGQSRTKSSYSCKLILKDVLSEVEVISINGNAIGKYENAFLANWIHNTNSQNTIINSSNQNELLYPMTIKTVNNFIKNVNNLKK
jgi:hypothetical protein